MKKKLEILVILLTIVSSIISTSIKPLFPNVNATYVENPITRDTVWTLVDSPFIISNNVTVYPSATLTIEPGVQVRFGGDFSLIISGKLYANGTDKQITFTSNKMQPEEGDWQSIVFNGAQRSILIGCFISHAKNAMFIENGDVEVRDSNIGFSQNGITATGGTLLVYNCTIGSCSLSGIDITDSECTIQKSTIEANKENGIRITGNEQVTIQQSNIMANGNGILLTGSESSNVNISGNKISANEEAGIRIDADNHTGLTILNNILSTNDEGIHISTSVSTQITNNSISYNTIGMMYDEGTHEVHFNDIYGNGMGMDALPAATVNAEQNYWGDPSGPNHESLNPEGRGNSVGGDGNVDFIFFLAKPIGYINIRPTAILLLDRLSVPPNEDIMLFATNSYDSDGRVDKYLFNFGDGSNSGWTTLSIFTHKYSSPSPPEGYNVTLTVMDDNGTTSNSITTSIIVQNLPSLQVSVDLSSSRVHEGEQVLVTVHVTNGTIALGNVTVSLFSVKNGNFTASSGLTDGNGYFTTTFTAPDITELANIRIVARAAESGYTDGSDFEYLEVSPFLSVQIIANPNVIKSEESAQISIYIRSNMEPVANASVAIACGGGSLSSENGITNLNGTVTLLFDAPQTVTFLNITITATATKEGYIGGAGETTIVIEPKILVVQITTSNNTTISEAELNVTVHVEYDGTPINEASVTVMAENGTFSFANGTTNENGYITFVYTAPPVNAQTNITITAQATKTRYAMGQSQAEITVNPRTFDIQIIATDVESAGTADITVIVICHQDSAAVANAIVTISSAYGDFSPTTKTTDATGTCTFIFIAPQTAILLQVTITVNVTKNGYVSGGSQTVITVSPKAQSEGGWSLLTILLILIPIIIAIVVVILIKLKVIVISTEEEEQ
jgi:co-chaperonin GroES (HSP10)